MLDLPEIPEFYKERVDKFEKWYKNAKPGDWYTYHVGVTLTEGMSNYYIKKVTWNYACDGKIYLFLRRSMYDKSKLDFLAQKASKVIPKLNPLKEVRAERN